MGRAYQQIARGHARAAVRGALLRLWRLCAIVWLAWASPARAERVELVCIATSDGAPVEPALWESVRELFARIGVRLTDDPAVGAPVAVLLTARHEGLDLRVSSASQPDSERHVATSASPELFRETVAHVILGMVEPLLDVTGAPAATPLPRERPTWRVGLHSGPVWLATDRLAARTGATAGLSWAMRRRVGLALDADFTPQLRLAQSAVKARAYLTSLRVRPFLEVLRRARLGVEVALPVGADIALLHVHAAEAGTRFTGRSARIDPVIGASLSGRLALTSTLSAVLTLGADVDLTPRRWTVRDAAGQPATLAELARVRPHASLGLSWMPARRAARSGGGP